MKYSAIVASLFGASLHDVHSLNVKVQEQTTDVTSDVCSQEFSGVFELTYNNEGSGNISMECLPEDNCNFLKTKSDCMPLLQSAEDGARGFMIHALVDIDGDSLNTDEYQIILDTGKGFQIVATAATVIERAAELSSMRIGVRIGTQSVKTFRTCSGNQGLFSFFIRRGNEGSSPSVILDMFREGVLLGSETLQIDSFDLLETRSAWTIGCDVDGNNCVQPQVVAQNATSTNVTEVISGAVDSNSTISSSSVANVTAASYIQLRSLRSTDEESAVAASTFINYTYNDYKETDKIADAAALQEQQVADAIANGQDPSTILANSTSTSTPSHSHIPWLRWEFLTDEILSVDNATTKALSVKNNFSFERTQPICGSGAIETDEKCDWAVPVLDSSTGNYVSYGEFTNPNCGCTCFPKCIDFTTFSNSVKLADNFNAVLDTTYSSVGVSKGDIRYIMCSENYSSGAQNSGQMLECTSDGVWTTPTLDCKLSCTSAPSIDDGQLAITELKTNSYGKYNHLATMEITCAPGYAPSEGVNATFGSIICNDGTWSIPSIKCYKTCGDFPDLGGKQYLIDNIDSSTDKVGALRQITCGVGFSSTTGITVQTARCELSGEWSPLLLDCQVNCNTPDTPYMPYKAYTTSLGDISNLPKLGKAGEWYEIGCSSGYTPTVPASTRERSYCLGGVWSVITMGCSMVCSTESEFAAANEIDTAAYQITFGGSNHGNVTTVACATGYSPAPTSVATNTTTNSTESVKVYSVDVRCLNGQYETPKLDCFKSCSAYSAPSRYYTVAGGTESGLEHGSYRTLQCQSGYEVGGKNSAQTSDEVYCSDGSWTATTLICAPGCSTVTLSSFFCDLDSNKTTCMSRFDMSWKGLVSNETMSKDWPASVPSGTEFYVKCQSNDTLSQSVQDGSRNVWRTVRCLGSENTALEVQWSLVSFNCGSRCDLGYVDFGDSYSYEMLLPGLAAADSYAATGFDSFQPIADAMKRVFTFDATDLETSSTILLETEQAFLSQSASSLDSFAASAEADSSHLSLLQLAQRSESGAWLHRAVSKSRADYFAKVRYLISRGLAVAAPSSNQEVARDFHKLKLANPSDRADDFRSPANKAMHSITVLHRQRIASMKSSGIPVPAHMMDLMKPKASTSSGMVRFNPNAYTGRANYNFDVDNKDGILLAWPRLPFTMPSTRDLSVPLMAYQHQNGAVSFIQRSHSAATDNTTNVTSANATTTATNSTNCEDADDIFTTLLGARGYTTCAMAISENNDVCDMTAKRMMQSISANIPPSFTLDPEVDMGLICAHSCAMCNGRDAYAAASFEKDIDSVLNDLGECLDRDSTVTGITPGWECADVVALRGMTQCAKTISQAFSDAGVDASLYGLTESTLANPFYFMCPVTCGSCPTLQELKDATKALLDAQAAAAAAAAGASTNSTEQDLIDSRMRQFESSDWYGLLVPHATQVRIKCADGYTDTSLFAREAEADALTQQLALADGDGVSVASTTSTTNATTVEDGEVLMCNLGAWSPRTLTCATHCDDFALPDTLADQYLVSGTGNYHSASRTLTCAQGSYGTLGSNTQDIYCLDGKWTARTLICRKSCSSDSLPVAATGVTIALLTNGIDTSSEEGLRYSHGSQWTFECTPTAVERQKASDQGTTLDISTTYNSVEIAGSSVSVVGNTQTISCMNGQWSQLVLLCKRDCGSAPLPDTSRYRYTANKRSLDEWAFLTAVSSNVTAASNSSDASANSTDSATSLVQMASSVYAGRRRLLSVNEIYNPDSSQISTRHGDFLNITCAEDYSVVAGPEAGYDTLRCLDGQWQQQTLVCKKDCVEWSPSTDELMSNRYIIISPDGTPDYPSITNSSIHHGMQRILQCNTEEFNAPITAATESRITCLDGEWSTPVLLCRRSCMPLNPAPYSTGFLFSNFPPWGYCVWDPNLQSCVDVDLEWRPPHDTSVYLNCAPGFSPVAGTTPSEVSCNDGLYTTIWLTCAPDCDVSKLQIPVGMKILNSVVGQVDVQELDPATLGFVSFPNSTTPATHLPNPDKTAVAPANYTSLLQLHSSKRSVQGYNTHKLSSGAYHHRGSRVRVVDGRFSAEDLSDTTTVSIDGMTDYDSEFDAEYSGSDTSVYSASILQAMAARGEIELAAIDLSNVPVTPNSVIYFGCDDWAAPAPGTETGNSVSCFWGSWTLRTLQCRGKCSGDAPRQMLSQYEKSAAYNLYTTADSFLPGGVITVSCTEGYADPWPARYGGGNEESAVCTDGEFSALSMSCMRRCQPHPYQTSERYSLYAETTYGSEGVYQHGSVMRIECQDGYTSSTSSNNETTTCVDSIWSAIAMQCYKNCPVIPNPGLEYWVGPMTDRLRDGWAGDTTQYYAHGEDVWVACSTGHSPGLGKTVNNVTVACNDGVFTNTDLTCYASCAAAENLFFDNYKYKFKYLTTVTDTGDVHNTQVQVSCNTDSNYYATADKLDFKEILTCKDGSWGEPKIKCRQKCDIFGSTAGSAGITAANGYVVKAVRPSTMWTPGKVEKQYDPSVISSDQAYHLHGSFRILSCNTQTHSISKRNQEGTVMPWEGDLLPSFNTSEISVTITSNQYTSTADSGSSMILSSTVSTVAGSTTAVGTEVVLQDGQDAMVCDDGEWRGRNLVCVRKCAEFVHPLNLNSGSAKRYQVFRLAQEQYAGYGDDVEAEMSLDLVEIPQLAATANFFVNQGSRRIITCSSGFWAQNSAKVDFRTDGTPATVTECKDGIWTQTPLNCMRICTEPFPNSLYRMCKDYHLNNAASICANSNWKQYFSSKTDCVKAVCSVPFEGDNLKSVGSSSSSDSSDSTSSDSTSSDSTTSDSSDVIESVATTGDSLRHNLSPYKIYRTVVGPDVWNFPDLDSTINITDPVKVAMLTLKPGDSHIVMCNAQAGFGPVYKTSLTVMNGGTTLNSVAVVSCIDGVWSDMPFRCDRGCVGAFDIYQSWERWLPVFTSDLTYATCTDDRLRFQDTMANYMANLTGSTLDVDKNWAGMTDTEIASMEEALISQFTGTVDYGAHGLDLSNAAPQGPLLEANDFGGYVKTHDLVGRADGMKCSVIEDGASSRIPAKITVRSTNLDEPDMPTIANIAGKSSYKWPMGRHWAVWGPGCCDPSNCWSGSSGTCKKRIYGRGTWVAYEVLNPDKKGSRDSKRAVFYARCTAGAPMKTPYVSFVADVVDNQMQNVNPQIQWKNNADTTQTRMFSWSTPELPLTYGTNKPFVLYPTGIQRTVAQDLGKVARLDCSSEAGSVIKTISVTYKSVYSGSTADGSTDAFSAVSAYCDGATSCKMRVINTVFGLATGFADCPTSWTDADSNRQKSDLMSSDSAEALITTGVQTGISSSIVFSQLEQQVSKTGSRSDVASEHFSDPGIHPRSSIHSNPARLARLAKNEAHIKALLKSQNNKPFGILVSGTTAPRHIEDGVTHLREEEQLLPLPNGADASEGDYFFKEDADRVSAFIQRSQSKSKSKDSFGSLDDNVTPTTTSLGSLSNECDGLIATIVYECVQEAAFPDASTALSDLEVQVRDLELSVVETNSDAYRVSSGIVNGTDDQASTVAVPDTDALNATDTSTDTT